MTDAEPIPTIGLDATSLIGHLIQDAFGIAAILRKPEAALTVMFRTRDERELTVALWAPMNYVGVFIRDEKPTTYRPQLAGEWTCVGYHDSCWRDTLHRFLWENSETIAGMGFHGMKVVVVDREDQEMFREKIKVSYKR